MLINPSKPREGIEPLKVHDVLTFISPPVDSLEFIKSKIAQDEEKARKILHLQTSNSVVKGAENMTATGMSLDNQAMQAFVKTQSDLIWDKYKFVVDRIGYQRYGDSYKQPTIIPPTTFEFLTPEDYMKQVIDAVNAKAPPFMIRTLMLKYLQSIFYNQGDALAVYEIVVHADRLLTMDSEDVAIGLSKGTVAKWESILHDSVIPIIQNKMLEETGWMEKELGEKIDDVIEEAKRIESEIGASMPQQNSESIINGLLSSPVGADVAQQPMLQPAVKGDELGKLPLAAQQLGLALTRANEAGNPKLAAQIEKKMQEIIAAIEPA
jgi:hypothetical protein